MTKPNGNLSRGRCIHCLQIVDDITSDHVFPKSWYPDTTPQNLEKWQAPACRQCNANYGRLEENLLLKFGMCLDRGALASSGIGSRVLDALNPARARNSKDFEIRLKKALRMLEESVTLSPQTPRNIVNSDPSRDSVVIEKADLEKMGEKIVRGLVWVYLKQVVDEKFEITVSSSQRSKPDFDDDVKKIGSRYDRGPGIDVHWAGLPDDEVAGIFLMIIFGKIFLRAVVMRR